jgi:gamma-glutamyltranspeptidase / glutathione hydrolase
VVRTRTFAVASAHPLSTAAGLEVLRQGGNAYDAALAVSAALPVVQPHMNGLGSDFFALVRERSTVAINSSGPAGRSVAPEVFRRRGLVRIPARGPLASITVPGLVAAWSVLGRNLRLDWRRDLAPAIRLAADGFPSSPNLARAARSARWGDLDFRSMYGAVASGRRLRQPALASTLRDIARDEGYGFYHGELARRICRDLRAKGGLLERSDFEEFSPRVEPPLGIRYRSFRVETSPPPSQGATALIWLNLLARRDLSEASEPELVRSLTDTMRIAYQYRARYIADPEYLPFPRSLLRPKAVYTAGGRSGRSTPGASDTTSFAIYDGETGISAIQSNYGGFGSGVVVGGTGISLNNRGSYFTLEADHPNALAPGKRTFHTLMATVVSGPRLVLLGSMGGDVQPQVNVQVLVRHLDRGWPLPSAIAAPRFAYPASIYGTAPLYREAGVPLPGARLLRGRPHLFGHAQGISVGEEIEVGIDPRGDGLLPLPS